MAAQTGGRGGRGGRGEGLISNSFFNRSCTYMYMYMLGDIQAGVLVV